MKPATLAKRLRLAQTYLDPQTDTPGKYCFICHAIQLGVYAQEPEGEEGFNSDPSLPEIALLVEMGMDLGATGFLDCRPLKGDDLYTCRQGARFMLLEFASLLAEDAI